MHLNLADESCLCDGFDQGSEGVDMDEDVLVRRGGDWCNYLVMVFEFCKEIGVIKII